MKNRGFTVVELVVVILVMGILLALALAGMRGGQIAARNELRKSEAEVLARGLEQYYTKPDNRYIDSSSPRQGGRYPSVHDHFHALGWDLPGMGYSPSQVVGGYKDSWLTGVPSSVNKKAWSIYGVASSPAPAGQIDNTTVVQSNTSIPLDVIVYEPLSYANADFWGGDRWEHCYLSTSKCERFVLYYKVETLTGGTETRSIRSKRQ